MKLLTCFYIKGSSHPVTYCGNKKISIGCKCHTISEWKKIYKKIGEENDYSESQLKEYITYIKLAEQFSKITNQ